MIAPKRLTTPRSEIAARSAPGRRRGSAPRSSHDTVGGVPPARVDRGRRRIVGRASICERGRVSDASPYLPARAEAVRAARRSTHTPSGGERCRPELPRSSRSVAAASRWSRATAARRLRALADGRRRARGCASCRPRPATPTTTSCASTGASPRRCEPSHVSLFRRDQGAGGVEDDLATHLLAQDLIYVGGGNVAQHARRLARARARRRCCAARGARASCCAGPRPARCAGSSRR